MMSVKDLIISLKHGATTQKLMERYQFQTEEALYSWIKHISPVKYSKFLHQIKQNDKQIASSVSSTKNVVEIAAEMLAEIDAAALEEAEYETEVKVEQNVITEKEMEAKNEQVPQVSELEQLQKDENEMAALICILEGKHKACVQERREIVVTLNHKKQELETLLQKIKECEQVVTVKYENYTKLASEMQNLDSDIHTYRAFLQEIRGRIEELKQVLILVSRDNVEIENHELPQIALEEVNAEFEKLLKIEDAEELTLKEIKTLAKLLLVVRNFDKYEVLFDNIKMEEVFKKSLKTLV